jgi:hypothetical protein
MGELDEIATEDFSSRLQGLRLDPAVFTLRSNENLGPQHDKLKGKPLFGIVKADQERSLEMSSIRQSQFGIGRSVIKTIDNPHGSL